MTHTRKFNGKVFKGEGPYYCPSGLTWNDLKHMVDEYRETHHVRVVKTKRKIGTNTHEVWLYIRRK